MARVAWSTLHTFVGSEHRSTLVHLSSPSARFTRVITLKLRPLHRMGCPCALSDACFKEPSAAPCRAVNHALAAQDARLERRGDQF
jgi:hypothetical protein